jgi:hypothetical protein
MAEEKDIKNDYPIKTYNDWCVTYNCEHAHCPYNHEHPQPMLIDGKLYCGYCWFKEHIPTEMIPCTPDICDDFGS